MKILLLTNSILNDKFMIYDKLKNVLENNITMDIIYKKIKLTDVINYNFIISFGYKYIVNKEIINNFGNKIVNCHISYLPYNRGFDPNLWSILTNTPSGITIHLLSEKLDQGDIIYQEKIKISEEETLQSSYNILIESMIELVLKNFNNLINCNFSTTPQDHSNKTYHEFKNRPDFDIICPNSWDTKIKTVKELYTKHFLSH